MFAALREAMGPDAAARRSAAEALSRWERGATPGFAGSLAAICSETARAAPPRAAPL